MEEKDVLHLMMKKSKKVLAKELSESHHELADAYNKYQALRQEYDTIKIDRKGISDHMNTLQSKIRRAREAVSTIASVHFPDANIDTFRNSCDRQVDSEKPEIKFLRYMFNLLQE